jgi:hypothetical protein
MLHISAYISKVVAHSVIPALRRLREKKDY